MKRQVLLLVGIFASLSVLGGGVETGSQDTINHVDGNGKKQGYWIVTGKMVPRAVHNEQQRVEEGNYQTSRKVGLWKKYFPNEENTVNSEINYRSGKPFGDYVIYFDNGVVEERGFWSRNRMVGKFERNYADGTPRQRFVFDDTGKRSGVQEYFYPNGQLAASVAVTNGRKNGKMTRYWPDGKVKEEMKFAMGKLDPNSVKEFAASREFEEEEVVIEDQPEEVAPKIDGNKEKVNAGTLNCNGYNKLFNRAGQITQEGHFKNCRVYEGHVYNYKNGILVDIDVYKKGYFVGKGIAEVDDEQ